ncbi:MAG: hypothetical protein HY282_00060 [Nitrospirae bacterium]|nr:hypothetical protein [Candidatus Manganitrophaceae bacterium]
MPKSAVAVVLFALTLSFLSSTAEANHLKVYGYQGPDAGEVELVYWTDYIAASDLKMPFFGKNVDREGLWNHTMEVEYGITDRWAIAGYLDFEQPSGEGLKYVQWRAVVARYRFFERGERFFNPAIYLEYYFPSAGLTGEPNEKLEARIILEKQIGPTVLRLNPKLEKTLSGPDVEEGLEFEYAASFYARWTATLEPGIEFYGNMGEVTNLKSRDQQQHYIVPAISWRVLPQVDWNFGVAFGLTKASDDLIVKSIIEIGL